MSIGNDRINQSLRAALDLRWQRHELLAHNLANADTPGFRPKDLEFEGVLQSVDGVGIGASGAPGAEMASVSRPGNAVSLGAPEPLRMADTQAVIERPEVGDTLDDNAVDTDKELARVADNSLTYQAELELLRRRYAAIQRAITSMSGA